MGLFRSVRFGFGFDERAKVLVSLRSRRRRDFREREMRDEMRVFRG